MSRGCNSDKLNKARRISASHDERIEYIVRRTVAFTLARREETLISHVSLPAPFVEISALTTSGDRRTPIGMAGGPHPAPSVVRTREGDGWRVVDRRTRRIGGKIVVGENLIAASFYGSLCG